VDAEFTPNGARDEGSVGSEEPSRVTQRGTRNVVAEVVSVVGSVGEVEGLRDQLNIDALAEFEVLGELGIQFEERLSAQRVILSDGALQVGQSASVNVSLNPLLHSEGRWQNLAS
jgi:hypothetical protein